MEAYRTGRKCVLPSGSVLRQVETCEKVHFIFLETERANEDGTYHKTEKMMLWNGTCRWEADMNFVNFKDNPLITGL